jgi:hypothetical protein
MPKNRNIQDISQIVEKAKNSTQRAFVNGQILEVGTNAFNIQLGANVISQQAGKSPTFPGASLNLSAFNVLAALGVTLSHEKKSYSLLDNQTDTQIVENIAIFDPIYDTLTNKAVEAKDKFSNNKDPFYELDNAPPKDEAKRREKIIEDKLTPRVESITADLVKTNLESPTTPTLKQFKNSRDFVNYVK